MLSSPRNTKVAFSVTNCICFDQRVKKIAGNLEKLDCEITIIGRRLGRCCDKDLVPFGTKRFRMIFRRGFLFYKFYNLRLFFFLLFHNYDVLVANDLDTLLPNYLVSRMKRIPLVYDSHEYFTGVPELNGRPFVRKVWKLLEAGIFPNLKYVMTVSDSVADQYQKEYGVRPAVVRNCSVSSSSLLPFSRQELGIPEDHFLLVFQGGGINIDKGGEELIDAIRILDKVSLLIVGSGDVLPDMKRKTEELGLSERIRFFPTMPWEEMIRYTKSADAGLSLEKDTNLNYRFSLPNKLFDYISAGIPVITGDLPEIKKIIEDNDCGIIIPSITPQAIRNAIIRLKDDRFLLNKLRKNAVIASGSLNWEKESGKVFEFYKRILSESYGIIKEV
jgi:glycosyltransferase involved in cell wall biosynthesis